MRAVDKKVVWFNMGFVPLGFGMTRNERVYYQALKRLGITKPDEFHMDNTGACTHILRCKDNLPRLVCIVTTTPNKKLSVAQVVATMAHEATHVWQTALEAMRQDGKASDEIEAYAIQYFTQCLVGEIL